MIGDFRLHPGASILQRSGYESEFPVTMRRVISATVVILIPCAWGALASTHLCTLSFSQLEPLTIASAAHAIVVAIATVAVAACSEHSWRIPAILFTIPMLSPLSAAVYLSVSIDWARIVTVAICLLVAWIGCFRFRHNSLAMAQEPPRVS